jgi:thymidine kinase
MFESETKTNTNPKMLKNAYLELIIGPMFSGKTSYLLDVYKKCKLCNISIAVINHSTDNRYTDNNNLLSTHDKTMVPCILTKSLMDLWNYDSLDENYSDKSDSHMLVRSANVILINEGQFFEDLYPCVLDMLREKKQVYICGLDGDFQRQKFGTILDLIPMCDKVTKLNSLCGICKNGAPGIFSKRISNEKEQFLIGSDNYIPVCRNCYDI